MPVPDEQAGTANHCVQCLPPPLNVAAIRFTEGEALQKPLFEAPSLPLKSGGAWGELW